MHVASTHGHGAKVAGMAWHGDMSWGAYEHGHGHEHRHGGGGLPGKVESLEEGKNLAGR